MAATHGVLTLAAGSATVWGKEGRRVSGSEIAQAPCNGKQHLFLREGSATPTGITRRF